MEGILHEATHARLWRAGIRYAPAQRNRVDEIDKETQMAQWWTDEAIGARRARGTPWNRTRLFRTDANFPALVTAVLDPLARVDSAEYDARGNLTRSVGMSPYDGAKAVSQYAWTGPHDLIANVTPPVEPVTTFGYDGAGNRIWQQTGRM